MKTIITFCAGIMFGCTIGYFIGMYALVLAMKAALSI